MRRAIFFVALVCSLERRRRMSSLRSRDLFFFFGAVVEVLRGGLDFARTKEGIERL